MSDRPGKQFERFVKRSLEHSDIYAIDSNSQIPACDHVLCIELGWPFGIFAIIESKELKGDSFPFDRITENERKHLDGSLGQSGMGFILIECYRPNGSRYFACTWENWKKIEEERGYTFISAKEKKAAAKIGFKAPRRASGTASIWIDDDAKRPACIEELRPVVFPRKFKESLDLRRYITDKFLEKCR